MKIIHVNFSGSGGGAAIAVRRIHLALLKQGVDSEIWSAREPGEIQGTHCLKNELWQKVDGLKNRVSQIIIRWLNVGDGRSINLFPSRLVNQLNKSGADIIHLHWVNAEMISIGQLAKLKKPVIWTLHDMWPFCGAEHYTTDRRFVTGYQRAEDGGQRTVDRGPGAESRRHNSEDSADFMAGTQNQPPVAERPTPKSRFDLDRWMFRRKQRAWKKWRPTIVTPSHWLSDCAKESLLFNKLLVSTVHNGLDLEVFKPMGRKVELRRKYGIPVDKKVILFGAFSVTDLRKGGDLLEQALALLPSKSGCMLAIFGAEEVAPRIADIDTVALGRFYDDASLSELYNLSDVMCVPSRQEAFGQTASEPLACGIPVVAFGTTGLRDVIDHGINGYLATPFDVHDFARGIIWALSGGQIPDDPEHNAEVGKLRENGLIVSTIKSGKTFAEGSELALRARKKAEAMFDGNLVAKQYLDVYKAVLECEV